MINGNRVIVEKALHLTDYLRQNAERFGSKPAIIFENQQISWKELWDEVESKSRYFAAELGNQDQKIVDLLLANSIEFVVSYFAVLHAGHIALPLDPAFKKLELDAIIEQIPPALIITSPEFAAELGRHQTRVILAENIRPPKHNIPDLLRLDPKEQIASLTFTSGTTGTAKAAPNTHANHIWNIQTCSQVWDWTESDTLLVCVPLSHMLGIVMGLSGALYHANTLYLHRWFSETETLKALSSGKISFFSHAASAYAKLAQVSPANYDLSGVRLCVSGAAPLPPAVWQDFKNRFGIEIVETYGTTETGRIAGNRLSEHVLGSPGKPLPGVNLRLSDEGEVLIKSPGVFPGYYHNPAAAKAGWTSDGYWRTGDMAELRDGYVYLKGRSQERIRRFGYTVSPRDVEWAMHQLAGLKDIYVMGRQISGQPDDELVYFVVGDVTDDDINAYCKSNLLFAWRPDRIIHQADLPRTRSGKVRLGELKELAEQAV